MRLEPLSQEHLYTDGSLPFDLYTQGGKLLLAAGQKVRNEEQLAALQSQVVFVDDEDYQAWRHKLEGAAVAALRQNASIGEVRRTRAEADEVREETGPEQTTLSARWDEIVLSLEGACRDPKPGQAWWRRIEQLHSRARVLAETSLDGSLYYLVSTAAESTRHYSSRHALLAMLVVEQCAGLLGRDEAWRTAVGRAALAMNASVTRLQDRLAEVEVPLSGELREVMRLHPLRSQALLRGSGVDDDILLEAVRGHHELPQVDEAFQALAPGLAAARLLRRVDIFTARISRRLGRPMLPPMQVAREECMGPDGKPDLIGQAVLKAMGLYPPGSFVELTSGEIGIVLGRGQRANLPRVASLISASGDPMSQPLLRDTLQPRFAVSKAVPAARVKVRLAHSQLMALI